MKKIFLFYFIVNCIYAIWSYALTDPNLVVSSWPPFWNFQLQMWSLTDQHVTWGWGILTLLMLVCYGWIIKSPQIFAKFDLKKFLLIWLLTFSPLLLANNALSHDVFNYMFNARMVLKYQVDPHVRVALDFPYDPWTRFMHNTHTPAPYWYGWTALSLPVAYLGQEIFLLTWVGFRVWSVVALMGLFAGSYQLLKLAKFNSETSWMKLAMLAFHPLIGIELIANAHNDAWMMMLAVWGLVPVVSATNHGQLKNLLKILVGLLLLGLSMTIKYATLTLAPVFIWVIAQKPWRPVISKLKLLDYVILSLNINKYDLAVILLFIPLLTARSQWFHPWYLTWSLSFLPLMKSKLLRAGVLGLSVSSLFRYYPWLIAGSFEYTDSIQAQQRIITWALGIIMLVSFYLVDKRLKLK